MSNEHFLCDAPSRTYVDLDKASELRFAMDAAGLGCKQPTITGDFLREFFAANPDCWPFDVAAVLQWQAETCGGRPVSMWTEYDDDRPWIDWERDDLRAEGWREVWVWPTPPRTP